MKQLVVFCSLFMGCFSAIAQSGKQQKDTIRQSLEEVFITAQRKESQPLLVPYSVQKLNS